MAKYFKVIVTTEYCNEIIVKANSREDVENIEGRILNRIDLMDEIPEVNVSIDERTDYDDDDVEIDITKDSPLTGQGEI